MADAYKLDKRTYLDADGNVVDESDANAHVLLGIEGDEIPHDRAVELGLVKAKSSKAKGGGDGEA